MSWACSGTKRWVSLGSSSRAVGCCRKWPQILCSSLQKVESSPLPLSGGGESLPTSSRQGVTLRAGHKLPPCSLRSLGAQQAVWGRRCPVLRTPSSLRQAPREMRGACQLGRGASSPGPAFGDSSPCSASTGSSWDSEPGPLVKLPQKPGHSHCERVFAVNGHPGLWGRNRSSK